MSEKQQRNAKWIWADSSERNRPNQYVEFRIDLNLAAVPSRAVLRLSVDTDFAAWVNDGYAGSGQFTDFPEQRTFTEVDIRSLLRAGRNCLAILVHYCGVDHFSYLPGDAGLWFEIDSDGQTVALSDEQVRCRPSPCYRAEDTARIDPQRGFTFHYDASREDGWRGESYRCGDEWRNAVVSEVAHLPTPRPVKPLEICPGPPGSIIAQGLIKRESPPGRNIAELMQQDYLSSRRSWQLFEQYGPVSSTAGFPVRIAPAKLEGADGIYVLIDLGREECGFPELELDSAESCVIDIAIGEHLDDLRVRSHIGGRNFACRYVVRPGQQRFVHYLDRYAGRYVQLHITHLRGALELRAAGLLAVQYPVSFAGEFSSADSLCNQIWKTSRRTLHLCMFEHYEDCPWREQGLYANDSRNQMLSGYYAFGDYEFARASLDLLGRSTGPDGYQELCAPMKCPITIPSFTMTWLLAMDDYLLHSGDTKFIADYFGRMKQMVGQYLSTLTGGLLPSPTGSRYWHMYDWASGLDGTDEGDCTKFHLLKDRRFDAPLNFYLILVMQAMANIARALGDEVHAGECLRHAADLRSAAHGAFWDAGQRAYKTYANHRDKPHFAELTQSLALLAGMADDSIRAQLRRKLMDDDNGMVATTLSQSFYKFEAILLDESCGQFVRDRIARDWSKMLFAGATSFWETLNGGWDFHHAGSMCHGWSGIPVYFYGAYGLGIKPLAPGFARASLKPLLGLADVRGAVPTPRGRVGIALDREKGNYAGRLQAPPEIAFNVDRSRVTHCAVSKAG